MSTMHHPPWFSSSTTTTITATCPPPSTTFRHRSLHALTTTFSSPFTTSRRALGHRRQFSSRSRSHSPTSPQSNMTSPTSSISSNASYHTFGTPYTPRMSSSSATYHHHQASKPTAMVPGGRARTSGTVAIPVVPLLPPAALMESNEPMLEQRCCNRRPSLLDLEEERRACGNGLVEMLEPREVRWFGGLDGMLA